MKRITIIALVVAGVALLMILNVLIYTNVIRPILGTKAYTLDGQAMEPSIKQGQAVTARAVKAETLRRGDIVVYDDQLKPGRRLIHRIIALGGDQIGVRGRTVYLNGSPLSEPYIRPGGPAEMAPLIVPAGHVFVMGDNRGMSFDSRMSGPVPLDNIKGVISLGK